MAHKQHIIALDANFTNYSKFYVEHFKGDETVSVELLGMGLEQGLNRASAELFDVWFEQARQHLVIAERESLEHDTKKRQILPYTLVGQSPMPGVDFSKETFVVYQRTKKVGEARLAGNYSVGAGGHIDIADLIFDPKTSIVDVKQTVLRSLIRELTEEFIFHDEEGAEITLEQLVANLTYVPVGFLRDDTNSVGQVHLGVINIAYVPQSWSIQCREEELLTCEPGTPAQILARGQKFENWSQILLEEFAKVGKLVKGITPAATGTIAALTDYTDTIDSLVAQFGVSQEELLRLNPILQTALDNGGQCEGGWRLWITDPDASATPVDAAKPGEAVVINTPLTYVVKAGETFESICARFGVDGPTVKRMNLITQPVREHERMYLKVPEKFMIRPGDTVETIAYRFGLHPRALTKLNGYGEGEVFMAGRFIILRAEPHPMKDYVDSVCDAQSTL